MGGWMLVAPGMDMSCTAARIMTHYRLDGDPCGPSYFVLSLCKRSRNKSAVGTYASHWCGLCRRGACPTATKLTCLLL